MHSDIRLTDMSAYYVSIDASKYAPHSVLLLSLQTRPYLLNGDTPKRHVHICARIALSREFCGRLGVVETSHPSYDILDGKLYIVHPGTLKFDLVSIFLVIQYLTHYKREIILNILYIEN